MRKIRKNPYRNPTTTSETNPGYCFYRTLFERVLQQYRSHFIKKIVPFVEPGQDLALGQELAHGDILEDWPLAPAPAASHAHTCLPHFPTTISVKQIFKQNTAILIFPIGNGWTTLSSLPYILYIYIHSSIAPTFAPLAR